MAPQFGVILYYGLYSSNALVGFFSVNSEVKSMQQIVGFLLVGTLLGRHAVSRVLNESWAWLLVS